MVQCEEGAAVFPVTGPAHALNRPTCVRKREEMIQNVVFVAPGAVLASLRRSLIGGRRWDWCCLVVQRAGHIPSHPAGSHNISASAPRHTDHQRLPRGPHQPWEQQLGRGALDTRRPGKADVNPSRGLPVCACPVSVLLLADCS